MKWLVCLTCKDGFPLGESARACLCGASMGHYATLHEVQVSGHCLVFYLSSHDLFDSAEAGQGSIEAYYCPPSPLTTYNTVEGNDHGQPTT